MVETTNREIEREEQIYHLTTLVAGAFSLQEVLDKLAEAAVKITGVKACSIRLLDEGAGELDSQRSFRLASRLRDQGLEPRRQGVLR